MTLLDVIIAGIALSMDAFAVAVCKGLSFKKIKATQVLTVGGYFGGFQALMPLLGYFLGSVFKESVTRYSDFIAFAILLFIGGKMLIDAKNDEEDGCKMPSLKFTEMAILSIATSIDAFAIGVSMGLKENSINIFLAVIIIGLITFSLSALGVLIGKKCGERLQKHAEILGGIILIALGIKILIEHFI